MREAVIDKYEKILLTNQYRSTRVTSTVILEREETWTFFQGIVIVEQILIKNLNVGLKIHRLLYLSPSKLKIVVILFNNTINKRETTGEFWYTILNLFVFFLNTKSGFKIHLNR